MHVNTVSPQINTTQEYSKYYRLLSQLKEGVVTADFVHRCHSFARLLVLGVGSILLSLSHSPSLLAESSPVWSAVSLSPPSVRNSKNNPPRLLAEVNKTIHFVKKNYNIFLKLTANHQLEYYLILRICIFAHEVWSWFLECCSI